MKKSQKLQKKSQTNASNDNQMVIRGFPFIRPSAENTFGSTVKLQKI